MINLTTDLRYKKSRVAFKDACKSSKTKAKALLKVSLKSNTETHFLKLPKNLIITNYSMSN